MDVVDNSILDAISKNILTPDAIDYVMKKAGQIIEKRIKQKPNEIPKLESEVRKLRKKLDRFMKLIAGGDAPDTIMKEIGKREKRIQFLESEMARYSIPSQVDDLQLRRLKKKAVEKMKKFNDLMYSDVPKARQALRKLLKDDEGKFSPIMFFPEMKEGVKVFKLQVNMAVGSLLYNNRCRGEDLNLHGIVPFAIDAIEFLIKKVHYEHEKYRLIVYCKW